MKKVETAKSKKAKNSSKPRKKAPNANLLSHQKPSAKKFDEEQLRNFKDFHDRMKAQILKNLSNPKKPPTP